MFKSIFNIIWLLFVIIFVFYIFVVIFFYFFQDKFVYYPSKRVIPPSFLNYKNLYIKTQDNQKINGWLFKKKVQQIVVFFHGNAGNISDRLDTIQLITENLNLSLLIFDYRGYGDSTGQPTENGIYKDAKSIYQYVIKELKYDPNDIILWGRSLGGAVAIDLACNYLAKNIIIESSFLSIMDLGRIHYPFLPINLICKNKFNSIKKIDKLSIPKLIIHSLEDEIIPFNHGNLLYNKSIEPKTFLEIKGKHNDGWISSGDRYIKEIKKFIKHKR